jgi:hypothetical protein
MLNNYQEIYDSLLIEKENLLKEINNEYEIIKWSRNELSVHTNTQINTTVNNLNNKIQEHNQHVKEVLPAEIWLMVKIIFIGF